MTKILVATTIASILTAILYRLGGMGGAWWKNTKVRDVGVPAVCITWCVMFINVPWYLHAIAGLAMFGALTTYWDEIFGYDNFYFHGLIIGLAFIPYLSWIVVFRAILIALFMGAWCNYFKNDYVEECGRGFIIGATLPLLLI